MPAWWPYLTLFVSTSIGISTVARKVNIRGRQVVTRLQNQGTPKDIAEVSITFTIYLSIIVIFAIILAIQAIRFGVETRTLLETLFVAPTIGAIFMAFVFAYFRIQKDRTLSPDGRLRRISREVSKFSKHPLPAFSIAVFGIYSLLDTAARGLAQLLHQG